MSKKGQTINANTAAMVGFIFAVPFLVTNFIVSLRLEPFYSFLGSFPEIRNNPLLPLLLLLLFPVGIFIVLLPTIKGLLHGKKKIYVANSIIAAIMLAIFLVLFSALGYEFYECELLKIPNCD